jgi:hypothetical protein
VSGGRVVAGKAAGARRLPDTASRRHLVPPRSGHTSCSSGLPQVPGARLSSLSVDHSDGKVRHEESRRHIRVRIRTVRDVQVTRLFRCCAAGSYLYLAAGSYRSNRLRISAPVLRLLSALALFLTTVPWTSSTRGAMSGPISDALFWVFPTPAEESSFDIDDVLIYLKTLRPSVHTSVIESYAHHGTDMRTLKETLIDLGKTISSAGPSTIIHDNGSIFRCSQNTVRGT